MELLLSDMLQRAGLTDEAEIVNEQPFELFSRATTELAGKKCIFLCDMKYIRKIDRSVMMVITDRQIAAQLDLAGCGVCITDEPRGLFFELMSAYEKSVETTRFQSRVGENCMISKSAVIASDRVIIGDNVRIGDFVVIHPNTTIGDNVTIQTGARIGEQDFNIYSFRGKRKQAYHGGHVRIGSDVLIQPGVTIGQAMYSYGVTALGDRCAVGANTCIGHNSDIGDDCEICGNSMLGGYCRIGAHSKLFMSVTIKNAITIGEHVTVNMGSNVIRDVSDGKTVFGNPAREIIVPV